jgi:hypothetical protein
MEEELLLAMLDSMEYPGLLEVPESGLNLMYQFSI